MCWGLQRGSENCQRGRRQQENTKLKGEEFSKTRGRDILIDLGKKGCYEGAGSLGKRERTRIALIIIKRHLGLLRRKLAGGKFLL